MKRLLLSFALLFSAVIITNAQVQQGDSNIGFATTLNTTTGVDPSSTSFTLFLSYEIFVTDNLSLGAGPLLSVFGTGGTTTTSAGVNLFSNYSFLTSGGVVLPYAGALISITGNGTSSDTFDSSVTNIGLGIKGGMKVFLTERINLDTNLNYSTNISTTVTVDGNTIDGVDPEGGQLQLFAGIGIILGKRGS